MATYESGSWKNLPADPDAPDWRGKAGELLPELRNPSLPAEFCDEIANADSPMSLWMEIGFIFNSAYEEPHNEDLIRRIYAFADWCLLQPQRPQDGAAHDLPTCVVVCFYEDIPDNDAVRLDMPRWFTREDIVYMEPIFRYSLYLRNEQNWLAFLTLWDARPTHSVKEKRSL